MNGSVQMERAMDSCCKHGFIWTPAQISTYIYYKAFDEISYLFRSLIGCTSLGIDG